MKAQAALLAAALIALPFVVHSSFHLNAAILVFLFGAVAQAWNILGGYAGQLSFGHSVFFGIGAYTSSVLLSRHAFTPWVGAPAGALLAAAVSLIVGTPTFRLRRHFFALATLALGEIARITFLNWSYAGAAIGLYLPLQYRNIGAYMMWDGKRPYYMVALGLCALTVALAALIDRTRMGPYLRAINADEDAARALGLHVLRYKQWAIATSAALTALAGSVYAQYVLYIDPYNVMTARISLLVVVIALIGGRGTVWGPALGAVFIVLLSEYSRTALGHLGEGYDFIVFGAVIMALSLYEPRGLYGLVRRVRSRPLPQIAGASQDMIGSPSPVDAEVVLSIEDISKRFGGIAALDHVGLLVRRGEILCLIGPNGAGKSTLFDCITGFQRPDAGAVRLRDASLTGAPAHRVALLGVVRAFQLVRVFSDLTVWEHMLVAQPHRDESVWAALRRSTPRVEGQAQALLQFVGLLDARGILADELSYGQQKLLAFAMALMSGAEVILLDEPTAGVSPQMTQQLIGYVREMNRQGRTFVIIEHNMAVVDALAHRVYFMADGRMLAEGTPEQVRNDPQVLETYYGR